MIARQPRSGKRQAGSPHKSHRPDKEAENSTNRDEVVLRGRNKGLAQVFDRLTELPADMMRERPIDHPPQRRKRH